MNPSHSQFVFCAQAGISTTQIYKMGADGSGLVRLTSDDNTKRNPRFTPDGKQIIFIRDNMRRRNKTDVDIYIMNADGTQPRALTQTTWNEVWFDVR